MARATLTATGTRDYLEQLDQAADSAGVAAGGYRDRYFRVARDVIRVRFAGPALVDELTKPLRHVEVSPVATPSLTIHAWDSESTAIGLPEAGGELDPHSEHFVRQRFGDSGASFLEAGKHSMSVLDAEHSRAHLWLQAPGRDRIDTLNPILMAWLPTRQTLFTHAGAVGQPTGCVLIVGRTGAGKSTAAAACLERGMGYLGDDNCLIGPGQPPTVFSVYDSLQLVYGHDKATSHVSERMPEALLLEAELRAIAIVHITGEPESRTGPATPAAALAALAPSSILQRPALQRVAFRRLAVIVRSVPCHRLEVGIDPDLLAETVAGLL